MQEIVIRKKKMKEENEEIRSKITKTQQRKEIGIRENKIKEEEEIK